jgi:hypothetical protein
MATRDQPGGGWTMVLRRQPARMVAGRPEAGYTDAFEIICCDCGHHPDQDYSEVAPELQRIRGPYPSPTAWPPMRSTWGGTASRPVPTHTGTMADAG